MLVIATFNELYFWDWSKPEPFMHVTTNSVKEKVGFCVKAILFSAIHFLEGPLRCF